MHKIDFLEEMRRDHHLPKIYRQPRQSKVLKFATIFLLVISIILFSFSWQVFSSYQNNKTVDTREQETGIINNIGKSIKNLVSLSGFKLGNKQNLKGEKEDRINVLLLGIGGKGHDGAYLSDTIIIASIKPSTKKISMISVPRDLYVPIGEQGWHKINHADAYGETISSGYGPVLASQTISKIFDVPIHYYVRVDFDGFKQIIDDIGKIKIYVENSFTDEKYPDSNYGYDPVSFNKGFETMNGDRALKYVRSRHGDNDEGSDFARSERQQKVLVAVKEKLSSYRFWLNPKKIGQVLADLDNHITTNMKIDEIISLAKIAKNSDLNNINHVVLTEGPTGQLYATNINGEYVLLPKGNDFTPLKIMVKNIFSAPNNETSKSVSTDIISIEIQNGTTITGLASSVGRELKQYGFTISGIGNAENQDYEETIVYDLTQNTSPEKIKIIEEKFETKVETQIPSQLMSDNIGGINTNSPDNLTDLLIILGKNANEQ